MDRPVITALADLLRRHVPLGKSRLETMALRTVGMIGASTVNPVHVADERGEISVDPAATYRRLQRFFQHARLPDDWAARRLGCPTTGLPDDWVARRLGSADDRAPGRRGRKADPGPGPDQHEDRGNLGSTSWFWRSGRGIARCH